MNDVTIRRCVLRIRRHGGWSWGPDPDALLGAATRALPRLIAEHVRELDVVRASGGGDVRITTPVRLHVKASLEELVALAATAHTGEPVPRGALGRRIEEAFAQALAGVTVAANEEAGERSTEPAPAEAAPLVQRSATEVLVATLVRWARDATIDQVVAAMPVEVRARWLAQLVAIAPQNVAEDFDRSPEHARAIEAARVAVTKVAARDPDVIALAAIGAALASHSTAGTAVASGALDARAISAVRAALTVVRTAAPLNRVPPEGGSARGDDAAPRGNVRVSAAASSVAAPARIALAPFVTSALPFLALVPLARCGWLDAAGAILDGAGAAARGPALAAALAYKLLPPPEQGWLRAPTHRDTAAVLAGRSIQDAELADAEHALAPIAHALTAPLTAELRRGHHRGAALLLVRDGERFALLDTDGLFVLATARELMAAVDAARDLGDVVLVPAAIATARVLDALECANLVFVTDAPPARGAPWRPVPRARLWTNDGGAIDRHASLAPHLADAAELAGEILDALRARPALPRSEADVLDRIATHAAALALADIAWNLFRARETATPMLALERFATLDAHVTPDDERIEVRVPLGRRHSDLLAHGYLTALPWLDGRVLHLMGG